MLNYFQLDNIFGADSQENAKTPNEVTYLGLFLRGCAKILGQLQKRNFGYGFSEFDVNETNRIFSRTFTSSGTGSDE